MYVFPDENFSNILYFNCSQNFWVAAALQHLQMSDPDADYVQRLPLQEITQMNQKTF